VTPLLEVLFLATLLILLKQQNSPDRVQTPVRAGFTSVD
jgi:hypothetical protein